STIIVDASQDTTARFVTLNPYDTTLSTISGLAPALIQYRDDTTNHLTIKTPSASGNVVNVLDTATYTTLIGSSAGTSTVNVEATTSSLVVDNGGGTNYVFVGSNGSGLGGTAQTINGLVYVYGLGSTALYVDDSADTTGRTATLNIGSIVDLTPAI